MSRRLSVVVPVYNSAGMLRDLVARLGPALRELATDFELLLLNDGSRDGSWAVIQELAAAHPWVRGFDMSRNFGQHNAIICGMREARFDTIITMDDDLQHPPEEIVKLLAKYDEGFDVVYGTPEREQHGLWRDLASQITKMAMKGAMGIDIARNVGPFRVVRTDVRRAFESYRSPFVSVDVLLTWGTTRFAAIPVRHDPRREGVSNYTFRKLVTHAVNMLTGFSTWPLQFASMVGFAFTLFGIGVLFYVVARYFIDGRAVPGFAFLASAIAIFSGAQLFAIGVIGEYLARMHFRMMEKPLYLVRTATEAADLLEIESNGKVLARADS
jgi:glycosyltransferase involved in cell wall biosynthesis